LKKILLYLFIAIAVVGLLFNLDMVLNMIISSLIFILVLGAVLYAVYYFFILTPSQRQYRRAVRKSRRKYKNRK